MLLWNHRVIVLQHGGEHMAADRQPCGRAGCANSGTVGALDGPVWDVGRIYAVFSQGLCKPSEAEGSPLRIVTCWDGNSNAVPSFRRKGEPQVTVHKHLRNSLCVGIEVVTDTGSGTSAPRDVVAGGGKAVLPW